MLAFVCLAHKKKLIKKNIQTIFNLFSWTNIGQVTFSIIPCW